MYCIGGHLATTIFLSGLFLEPFGSCSLTCKSLFIFFKRIFGVFVRVYISIDTVVFVVQFSRSSLPHRTACLLYHFPPPLSIPFLSFFPLFYFLCILYIYCPFFSTPLYALVTFKYSSKHNPLSVTLLATASPKYRTCHGSYIYPVISSFSLG